MPHGGQIPLGRQREEGLQEQFALTHEQHQFGVVVAIALPILIGHDVVQTFEPVVVAGAQKSVRRLVKLCVADGLPQTDVAAVERELHGVFGEGARRGTGVEFAVEGAAGGRNYHGRLTRLIRLYDTDSSQVGGQCGRRESLRPGRGRLQPSAPRRRLRSQNPLQNAHRARHDRIGHAQSSAPQTVQPAIFHSPIPKTHLPRRQPNKLTAHKRQRI